MPSPQRSLEVARLRQNLLDQDFAPRSGADRVFGVWSEYFAVRWDGPGERPLPLARAELAGLVARAAERCGAIAVGEARPRCDEAHARLGVGHGPKVWLATPLATTPAACQEAFECLEIALRAALGAAHVAMVALGSDPWRSFEESEPASDACDAERERCFAGETGIGLAALRSTARTGVVLGWGNAVQAPLRWNLARALVPIANALFAHSPIVDGVHPGAKALAARAWRIAAPDRTELARGSADGGGHVDRYLDFALAARVAALDGRATFGGWLERGDAGRHPEFEDWRRHLATLEPPVRPIGALEFVAADTQPRAFALAPLVFAAALLDDGANLPRALQRCAANDDALEHRREAAERDGLVDATLGADARALVAWAADSLLRAAPAWYGAALRATFVHFAERCALRGRSAADDLLEVYLQHDGLDRSALAEHERRALHAPSLARAG
jgi:glutamate--cysteine ligase